MTNSCGTFYSRIKFIQNIDSTIADESLSYIYMNNFKNLYEEFRKRMSDVCCLQEVRWRGQEF